MSEVTGSAQKEEKNHEHSLLLPSRLSTSALPLSGLTPQEPGLAEGGLCFFHSWECGSGQ